MSLVIAVKGTEGVVLSADSRLTLTTASGIPATFDNATKLLTFRDPHNWVGALTYGIATIGGRTPHSLIPEFEADLGDQRLTVHEYATRLSGFFQGQWIASRAVPTGDNANFYVGGYDINEPYGRIYYFGIPNLPTPVEHIPNNFGMSWGGQTNVVSRIILGHDPQLLPIVSQHLGLTPQQQQELNTVLGKLEYAIPYPTLALQDCIDLATYLIRATVSAQGLASELRGVGGDIDVATITRMGGFQWVQKKEIRGG